MSTVITRPFSGRVGVEPKVVAGRAAARVKRAALAIIAALSVHSTRAGTCTVAPSASQPPPQLAVGRHTAPDRQAVEPGPLERLLGTRRIRLSTIAAW